MPKFETRAAGGLLPRAGCFNIPLISLPARDSEAPDRRRGKQTVSPLREREVHAQVAATKSAEYYVRKAASRLENCGIDPTAIRGFMNGDLSSLAGQIGPPGTEQFAALSELLQALVMAKGIEPDDSLSEADRRLELNLAVQKVYLREICRLYERVVVRAAALESLAFSDPQLNEASRCYLYGFFRGTVILSASALETTLRSVIGPKGTARVNASREGFFERPVDEAVAGQHLGSSQHIGGEPEIAVYSRMIFRKRNDVAHRNLDPTGRVAEEILNKTREVLEFVHREFV
jgi:hypothetical protein